MPDLTTAHTTKHNKTESFLDLSKVSREDRVKYRARAFKLFKHGLGYRTVSSMLGISVYTVRDWDRLYKMGKFGPKIKHPGNCPENLSNKELRERVRTEHEAGASISSLSMRYGKCKSTIRYWVNSSRIDEKGAE